MLQLANSWEQLSLPEPCSFLNKSLLATLFCGSPTLYVFQSMKYNSMNLTRPIMAF